MKLLRTTMIKRWISREWELRNAGLEGLGWSLRRGMGQCLCSCTAENRNIVLLSSAVRCHLKHMYQHSCSSWKVERDPEQPAEGNREAGSDKDGSSRAPSHCSWEPGGAHSPAPQTLQGRKNSSTWRTAWAQTQVCLKRWNIKSGGVKSESHHPCPPCFSNWNIQTLALHLSVNAWP